MPQNRDIAGRFTPGDSGNPGGRPQGLARAARERLGDDGLRLIEFWLSVMEDPAAKNSDRIRASELLAERGWGKAPAYLPPEETGALGLTHDERDRIAEDFNMHVERLALAQRRRRVREPDAEGWSDEQITKALDVTAETVRSDRAHLEGRANSAPLRAAAPQ